ncbi:unnamed protein product [Rotaria sordida]|uniref:Uncharacterized protein n=1 Tax=Rotaria sordida TaxID=392033 RepID=A0A816DJH2_9BILA|nr:unnamed protein product [Rotaria sordida]CAF1637272.1 unnamed protein product [Rotaria sordida]
MLENLHEPNLLRVRINDEILRWVDDGASELVNFPVLSMDQIRTITVGVFQLKQARSYCEEHCSTTHLDNRADFPLQICANDPQLIRIRFKSRHSNTKTYHAYISFSTQDILNSCCDCPSGDRKQQQQSTPITLTPSNRSHASLIEVAAVSPTNTQTTTQVDSSALPNQAAHNGGKRRLISQSQQYRSIKRSRI